MFLILSKSSRQVRLNTPPFRLKLVKIFVEWNEPLNQR